jgi:hypothetical protein
LEGDFYVGKLGFGINFLITRYVMLDLGAYGTYGRYSVKFDGDNTRYKMKTTGYSADSSLSFLFSKSFNLSFFYNFSRTNFGSTDSSSNIADDEISAFGYNNNYAGLTLEFVLDE